MTVDDPSAPIDILLVEDQPYDAELALRALKELGLDRHVRVVRDGAEALAFMSTCVEDGARDLPRLILLDLKLPKVSGLEVLRKLKSCDHTRHIPIIALSSSQEHGDIKASYALGANSYVVKPVDFEQFTRTVKQIGSYWLTMNQPPA
jgi:CheY-like chemotaxis protein